MSAIKRNLGWLLVSQGATWMVSVAMLVIVPRRLGDGAFGQLTFAQVYVGFFELLAMFGTGTYLAKTLARDPASIGRYVVNTLALKLLMMSALIVVALGLATALGYPRDTVAVIGAFCIGLIFTTLNGALMGGLQGLQRMVRPALWEVARAYAGAGLGLLVLLNGGGTLAYAMAINIVTVIPLTGNLVNLWPELRRSIVVDIVLWRRILAGGFPFFVLSAFTIVYATAGVPLLQAFAGDETVGWYGLASRWVAVPVFFASTVSYAFFPALSAEGIGDRLEFARLANRALTVTFLVAAPAALGIALIADDFLVLLYGAEFREAVPLMRILALNIPLIAIDLMLGTIVIAADRQRQWVILSVIAAILNPLLNLALIPLTERVFANGGIGAAVTTVVTEILIFLGAIRLLPAGVLDRSVAALFGRITLASAAMVPVVIALGDTPVAVQVLAGAVTYAVASLAVRTVSLSDLRGVGAEFLGRQARTTVAQ